VGLSCRGRHLDVSRLVRSIESLADGRSASQFKVATHAILEIRGSFYEEKVNISST
jgi:hypothetical protein